MVRCCNGNRRYQIPDDDYPVLGTNTNFQFKKILKLHSCKICTIADHHDMKFQAKDYYCIFSTETEVLLLLWYCESALPRVCRVSAVPWPRRNDGRYLNINPKIFPAAESEWDIPILFSLSITAAPLLELLANLRKVPQSRRRHLPSAFTFKNLSRIKILC